MVSASVNRLRQVQSLFPILVLGSWFSVIATHAADAPTYAVDDAEQLDWI
jgi:hypothetical protein